MNELGWIVVGVAARSTALAAVGLLALAALRRRGPSAGALAGATTLAVLVGVAALAFSPWPRWWIPRLVEPGGGPSTVARPLEVSGPSIEAGSPSSPALPHSYEARPAWYELVVEYARELGEPKAAQTQGWRWPAWAACVFLLGLAVALIRLGLGLWAVRTLRMRSRSVDDPGLLALVDSLRSELGLRPSVELRESNEVATPATIGWRRPAVLLPETWRGWDDLERRAVLAHELAHVLRGDYLSGLLAQVSLSLHFYHPLVHALARRLRLQQELAADAWGARLSGGRRAYLTALANLALRQDPRPAAWPARPFLPTRGTFLRRIEMLRDPKALQQPPMRPRGRVLTVAALSLAGLLVAGLRGPGSPGPIQAQEPSKAKATTPELDPNINYTVAEFAATVEPEVRALLEFQPSSLFSTPRWKPLGETLDRTGGLIPGGLPMTEVAQYALFGFDRDPASVGKPEHAVNRFAWLVRATHPHDWKPYIAKGGDELIRDGVTYYRKTNGAAMPIFYRQLDDRTMIGGSEEHVLHPPIDATKPVAHSWDDAWKKVGPGPLRLAMDAPWLAAQAGSMFPRPGEPFSMASVFNPLLEKARAHAIGVTFQDGLGLETVSTSVNDADAGRVADTLRASLTIARNTFSDLHKAAVDGQEVSQIAGLVFRLEPLVEAAKVEQEGRTTRLRSKAAVDAVATATTLLMPAVMASREAERRAACVKNMKRICLALYTYEQQHGTLPPAVILGPDAKTPHSWRVAILPLLDGDEGKALFAQYKLDEPWDGPNNRKLLAKIPDVYAHPGLRDGDASHAAYFLPVGPATLFPEGRAGFKMDEIPDGPSNTIMVVEAKRGVPWTKPEDVAIVPEKPLPAFGGFHPAGFNAAFANGSVLFLKDSIDKRVLGNLFTAAGGEIISSDQR